MKKFRKLLFLFLLPLFAFTTAHKFYVSVTTINYSEKDDALQVTTRIFIDDLEKVLEERYDIKAGLATEEESEVANEYIEKYLRTKFLIKIDGEKRDYTYLGKKYDNDVIVCYLEVPGLGLEDTKSIEVQNELLTDLFEEQQNVVHLKINGKKKSFVLVRDNNKGMLNL